MRAAVSQALWHGRTARRSVADCSTSRSCAMWPADLALETGGVHRPGDPVGRRRGCRPIRGRGRGTVAPDRVAGGQVLDDQTQHRRDGRGPGVFGRQQLRRGVRHAAALPRSSVNSVWEGSGNVNALDLLRAMSREPGTVDAPHHRVGLRRQGPTSGTTGRCALCWASSPTSPTWSIGPGGWPGGSLLPPSSSTDHGAPDAVADAFVATAGGRGPHDPVRDAPRGTDLRCAAGARRPHDRLIRSLRPRSRCPRSAARCPPG